jgi:hypothetical protein
MQWHDGHLLITFLVLEVIFNTFFHLILHRSYSTSYLPCIMHMPCHSCTASQFLGKQQANKPTLLPDFSCFSRQSVILTPRNTMLPWQVQCNNPIPMPRCSPQNQLISNSKQQLINKAQSSNPCFICMFAPVDSIKNAQQSWVLAYRLVI